METLLWLIEEYGYVLVFLGTLLEGETVVALAGFAAYQEYLSPYYIILIAIVGSVIGDHTFFFLGRLKGRTLLAKRPLMQERIDKVHDLMEHYHGWIIFGSRFMYGLRTVIPIALGMSRVSIAKFSFFNFLGAVVWAIFFTLGGYLFGGAIEQFLGNVKKIEGFIILAVVVVATLVQAVFWLRGRKKLREAANRQNR